MTKAMHLILIAFTLLLSACASTRVEESWTLPGYQPPTADKRKVLVIALASKETTRKAFESAFVQALEARGILAVPSHQWMPESTKVNRDTVAPIVAQNGITSVMIGTLRGVEKSQAYQPPQQVGPGDNLYRNFDTYRVYDSSGQHETGTYAEMTEYLLEINLFNVATEKLSWSVRTRTTDSGDLNDGVHSIVDAVVKQAEKDKIF